MFDTVLGLPLHPLVVHAVVVLAPLTALLTVMAVASTRLRERIGVALPVLATVTWVAAFVAEQSGEALEQAVGESALVREHAELGERLPLALLVVTVLTWAMWVLHRRASRVGTGVGRAARVVDVLAVLAVVVLAVLVVLVGHSGAEAVWSGTGA